MPHPHPMKPVLFRDGEVADGSVWKSRDGRWTARRSPHDRHSWRLIDMTWGLVYAVESLHDAECVVEVVTKKEAGLAPPAPKLVPGVSSSRRKQGRKGA